MPERYTALYLFIMDVQEDPEDIFEDLNINTGMVETKDGVVHVKRRKIHREDGPAVEWDCGSEEWFWNGVRHRTDGPACTFNEGSTEWYINGKLHREDGPAFVWGEDAQWWLEGKEYTEEQFNRAIKLDKFLKDD